MGILELMGKGRGSDVGECECVLQSNSRDRVLHASCLCLNSLLFQCTVFMPRERETMLHGTGETEREGGSGGGEEWPER